jgi:hypothetical protein
MDPKVNEMEKLTERFSKSATLKLPKGGWTGTIKRKMLETFKEKDREPVQAVQAIQAVQAVQESVLVESLPVPTFSQPTFTQPLKRSGTLKNLTLRLKKPLEQMAKNSGDALQRSVSMMRTNSISRPSSAQRKPIPFIPPESSSTKLWQETLDDSSLLNMLSKTEIKRQELIYELIETERQYIADLKLVIEVRTFEYVY